MRGYLYNNRTKAAIVFVSALLFIGIFVLSSLLATEICQKWYGLPIGIAMMILAIPFHRLGKRSLWGYLASFLLNSTASGFVVSAYYLETERALDIYSLTLGVIPAVAVVLLIYLMLKPFNKTKTVTVTVAGILTAVLAILAIIFWIRDGSVIFSFAFFSLIISFFFLCVFGITVNHNERSVLRDVSFGGFGAFLIIAVLVTLILSDGELLEGLDFGGGSEGGKKGTKK